LKKSLKYFEKDFKYFIIIILFIGNEVSQTQKSTKQRERGKCKYCKKNVKNVKNNVNKLTAVRD